jgi:hypothetical protein
MDMDCQIGSVEMVTRDLPDLIEWVEKRVSRRKGTHPVEMVFLTLVAAECLMNVCRESWQFKESVDEAFELLKVNAKGLAASLKDEHNSQDN